MHTGRLTYPDQGDGVGLPCPAPGAAFRCEPDTPVRGLHERERRERERQTPGESAPPPGQLETGMPGQGISLCSAGQKLQMEWGTSRSFSRTGQVNVRPFFSTLKPPGKGIPTG